MPFRLGVLCSVLLSSVLLMTSAVLCPVASGQTPDFQISAAQATQSVIAGSFSTNKITVAPANGFTATVTFSAAGLPTGTAATFLPDQLTGGGSSILTITAAGAAAPGTYAITVAAVSGSLSHSVAVTLVVTTAPDFALSAAPATQTVAAGGSATYQADITALKSFTGKVTFSVAGLPPGSQAGFSPATVNTNGSAALTVMVAANTAAASYPLTITAASGSLAHSVSVMLVVTTATDFTLSVTPAGSTVTAGSGMSYTVAVSALNGFAGDVALQVTGVPAGTNARFTPAIISRAGSSTLNVTAGAGTPGGNYQLTVTGASGNLTHTATVKFQVRSFLLSTIPLSRAVAAGGSTHFQISALALNAFTGHINWDVAGLPSGATADFTDNASSNEVPAILHVTVPSETPGGTYPLTIRAVSGAIEQTAGVSLAVAARGADFYVSPAGSESGDGSSPQPWDLATALEGPSRIMPGDTVWLRGGIYSGNFTSRIHGSPGLPVTIRPIAGQRATIDGGIQVFGGWVRFRDLEVMNFNPKRISSQVSTFPTDITQPTGFDIHAPGVELINNVIHDTTQAIGVWTDAPDAVVYGNLIYYNGWLSPEDAHGHGIYGQNSTGVKLIEDNIVFDQFSHGIHISGSDASVIDNFSIIGNVIFTNGLQNQSFKPGYQRNLLIGGGVVAHNPVVVNNYTYYPLTTSIPKGDNNIGDYASGAGCTGLVLNGNYFVAGYVALTRYKCPASSVEANTIYGPVRTFIEPPDSSLTPDDFPNNRFLALSDRPAGAEVFLRPNLYDPGRGHIAIYNWDRADSVAVDLTPLGFAPGARFRIFDAQNYYGAPVVEGDFSGDPVLIPMSGTMVSPMVGSVPFPPLHTDREFGAFVVVQATAATPGPRRPSPHPRH
jgi:hypothetical protein